MRASVCLPRRLECACLTVCAGSSHRTVSCVSASCCSQPVLGVRPFVGVPSLRAGEWKYREGSSSSFCDRPRLTAPSQEKPEHSFLTAGSRL